MPSLLLLLLVVDLPACMQALSGITLIPVVPSRTHPCCACCRRRFCRRCKRNEVPMEKVFNKSLLSKFLWAMDVEPEFRF